VLYSSSLAEFPTKPKGFEAWNEAELEEQGFRMISDSEKSAEYCPEAL